MKTKEEITLLWHYLSKVPEPGLTLKEKEDLAFALGLLQWVLEEGYQERGFDEMVRVQRQRE